MVCKTGKICAVQHFDYPNNVTFPVCIPLSFVPGMYINDYFHYFPMFPKSSVFNERSKDVRRAAVVIRKLSKLI